MRSFALILGLAMLAAPAAAGECEDFISDVIRCESTEGGTSTIGDATVRDEVRALREDLAIVGRDRNIAAVEFVKGNNGGPATGAQLITLMKTHNALVLGARAYDAAITGACARGLVTIRTIRPPDDAVLELVAVVPADPANGFTFGDTEAMRETADGVARYIWSRPPRFITSDGFYMRLALEVNSTPETSMEANLEVQLQGYAFSSNPFPPSVMAVSFRGAEQENLAIVNIRPVLPVDASRTYAVRVVPEPGIVFGYLYEAPSRPE